MERRLFLGLIAVAAALVAVTGLAIASAWNALDDARLVAHTHEVRSALTEVLQESLDCQAVTRGFLITGDPAFLEPRREAESGATAALARLRLLVAADPAQSERATRLAASIEEVLRLSRITAETMEREGFEAARAVVRAREGKAAMDAARALCTGMDAEEERRLERRVEAARSGARTTTVAMAALVALVLGALALGYAYVRRNLARRAASEAEVRRLNADLGEQAARAEALAEERDRFFNASRDLLCTAGTDGLFRRVNPSWERTLGWTPEELLSRPFLEFVHPEDREATVRISRAISEGGEAVEFENRYAAKDGSWRWLSWNSRMDGEGDGLVRASARDITARKRAEEELRRAKEAAEAAHRELDAFAYSVSHDLRAPLRGIHGFCEAILEDNAGRFDAATGEHFRRVQAAATRMGLLVDGLLDLSRITRAELLREAVDLGALAEEVMADLRRAEPAREVDFHASGDLHARGDPRLLRVVLENLLGNAWKFTGRLPRASVEFGAEERGGGRRFFVRDNGAGFDMSYAGKLFGVFQRLHPQVEYPGTGIGLATVARVIHRHGGEVGAEGAPGRGATLWFTLPPGERGGGEHGGETADPAGG